MKPGMGKLRGRPINNVRERLLKDEVVKSAYDEHTAVLEAARFVRELRKNAGLTQQELAHRMGVSQAIIARLEMGDGKRGMTITMLSRVASACGKSLFVQPLTTRMTGSASLSFSKGG